MCVGCEDGGVVVISLSFAVFIRNGPNGCEKYDTRDASNPGDAWIPVSPADGNTVVNSVLAGSDDR